MITDPERIGESEDTKIAKGDCFLNILIVMGRQNYFASDVHTFYAGFRIVMNVTDMNKLMEINHDN